MYLFTSSANTKSAMATSPIISIIPDSPSRNKGRTKAVNTNADPVSCCRNTSTAGIPMIISDATLVRVCFHSTSMALMYLASANAVANLANSDGCNLKGPRLIHDVAPLVTVAINNVTTSSANTAP